MTTKARKLVASGAKIGTSEIGTSEIADNAITTAKIIDDAVTAAKTDTATVGVVENSKILVAGASGELDALDITTLSVGATTITSTGAELNILDGVTATAAELNESDLSAVGVIRKWKKLPIAFGDGTGENDTGWDLPTLAIVLNAVLYTTVAEATGGTKTLTVGTATGTGDPDGIMTGVDVSATGVVAVDQPTTVAGGTETYFSASVIGALMGRFKAGSDVATDTGFFWNGGFNSFTGEKSIVWTPGSADWAEFTANLYIEYLELA